MATKTIHKINNIIEDINDQINKLNQQKEELENDINDQINKLNQQKEELENAKNIALSQQFLFVEKKEYDDFGSRCVCAIPKDGKTKILCVGYGFDYNTSFSTTIKCSQNFANSIESYTHEKSKFKQITKDVFLSEAQSILKESYDYFIDVIDKSFIRGNFLNVLACNVRFKRDNITQESIIKWEPFTDLEGDLKPNQKLLGKFFISNDGAKDSYIMCSPIAIDYNCNSPASNYFPICAPSFQYSVEDGKKILCRQSHNGWCTKAESIEKFNEISKIEYLKILMEIYSDTIAYIDDYVNR